jgi:hypothetical protein
VYVKWGYAKVAKAEQALEQFDYGRMDVSAREFYNWMTGEIFSDDPTTLRDVLGNEYITIHEAVEISELKKMGRTIDKRAIVDSPKMMVYDAHLTAMETELEYALRKDDTFWANIRLRQYKESVLMTIQTFRKRCDRGQRNYMKNSTDSQGKHQSSR